MLAFAAPALVETEVFARLPDHLRRPGARSAWAEANKPGEAVDSFLEGPAFDGEGRLYVVDIPHGRILRVSASGEDWTVVAEYDGEPNGLTLHPDGHLLVADYRRGLVAVDPANGAVRPVLERRNGEGFKGLNDLCLGPDGAVYFTDQGQTGLHDPTGRVYRLRPDGGLDRLLDNGPSPNGLALAPGGRVLFVAMTRDNAVWRAPLAADGGLAKVGRYCTFFGTSGPDGLAFDGEGRLVVAHASLGAAFVVAPDGEVVARVRSCTGPTCTNVAFRDPGRRELFITESSTGTILRARL